MLQDPQHSSSEFPSADFDTRFFVTQRTLPRFDSDKDLPKLPSDMSTNGMQAWAEILGKLSVCDQPQFQEQNETEFSDWENPKMEASLGQDNMSQGNLLQKLYSHRILVSTDNSLDFGHQKLGAGKRPLVRNEVYHHLKAPSLKMEENIEERAESQSVLEPKNQTPKSGESFLDRGSKKSLVESQDQLKNEDDQVQEIDSLLQDGKVGQSRNLDLAAFDRYLAVLCE